MNKTIAPAAPPADRRGLPDDPPAAGEVSADALHSLVNTAAAGRPLDQVATLLDLLNQSGRYPELVAEALRTAAVSRPVHEVGELIDLLAKSPREGAEAEIALRAVALTRPVEDVAQLVGVLAGQDPAVRGTTAPAPVPDPGPPERDADGGAATGDAAVGGTGRAPVRTAAARNPVRVPVRIGGGTGHEDEDEDPGEDTGSGVVRRSAALRLVLRWPVALALLVVAGLHLPADPVPLLSAGSGRLLPAAVAALCLGCAVVLVLRDTTAAWWAAALAALSAVGLHVMGRVTGFEPLARAWGDSVPMADALAVLAAGLAAVLAAAVLYPAARRTGSGRTC
ncbi:hypothetical protein ACIQUQ_32575 [Streptomyces sp. NPDC101118]|uniref:hypothetical protein n=1 Tax=Streptomyces sp. NPDC101118 TaxID=3366109 RepID=UPI00380E99A2